MTADTGGADLWDVLLPGCHEQVGWGWGALGLGAQRRRDTRGGQRGGKFKG